MTGGVGTFRYMAPEAFHRTKGFLKSVKSRVEWPEYILLVGACMCL